MTYTHVGVEIATAMMDRHAPIYRNDAVIFISQSGKTDYTLNAFEHVLNNDAFCVTITNTIGFTIARNKKCDVIS